MVAIGRFCSILIRRRAWTILPFARISPIDFRYSSSDQRPDPSSSIDRRSHRSYRFADESDRPNRRRQSETPSPNRIDHRSSRIADPQPTTSRNVADQWSISEHIDHLRGYYSKHSTTNGAKELIRTVEVLEERAEIMDEHILRVHDFKFLLSCCESRSTPDARPRTLTELAERIWTCIPKFDVRRGHRLVNALLDVYSENRSDRPIDRLTTEAMELGLAQSALTRGNLLRAACQQGEMDVARRLFEDVLPKLDDSSELCANMVYGYLKIGDEEKAEKMMALLGSRSEWKLSAYRAIALARAERGEFEKVFETLDEAKNTHPDAFKDEDSLECIYVSSISSELRVEVLKKFLDRCWQWKFNSFLRTIQRLISIGRPRTAWHLYKATTKPSDGKGEEMIDRGNFLIHQMFEVEAPMDSIFEMCEQLQKSGFNQRPFLTALNLAYTHGMEDEAVRIIGKLREHDYEIRPQYLYPLPILRAKRSRSKPNGTSARSSAGDWR